MGTQSGDVRTAQRIFKTRAGALFEDPVLAYRMRMGQYPACNLASLNDSDWVLVKTLIDGLDYVPSKAPLTGFTKFSKHDFEDFINLTGASTVGYLDSSKNTLDKIATLDPASRRQCLKDLTDGTWAEWIRDEDAVSDEVSLVAVYIDTYQWNDLRGNVLRQHMLIFESFGCHRLYFNVKHDLCSNLCSNIPFSVLHHHLTHI